MKGAPVKIVYQGKETETVPATVGAFLAANGIAAGKAVIEYKGDVLSGEDAASVPLEDGAELNVFKIVAGG
ncbi:MAG: MoaD/ThiS family protein [Kiritimatiellae bacterium]|nr:MoaD/ThiS family protein [Kiritimatiellia bacterium]